MMTRHAGVILLLLLATGYNAAAGDGGQACAGVIPGRTHGEQCTTLLKKDLFCNYDKLVRPTNNYSIPTTVRFFLLLNSIEINEESHGNSAKIQSLTAWSWTDAHMQWEPSLYDNIKFFYTDSGSIWIPELVLQNQMEFQSMSSFLHDGRCVVHSTGLVVCNIPSSFHTLCVVDTSRWPFDTHTCSLALTTVNDAGNNYVDLSLLAEGYSLQVYVSNREWQLLKVTVNRTAEAVFFGNMDTSLKFEFSMKRHSALYAATILASALLLCVMTAASFWIDPESPARVMLCCMDIFIQCLYLQHLQYSVGSNGDFCPRIVLFYRDSLLLAGLSLVTAVLGLRLSSSSSLPPGWSSGVVQWLLEYRLAQVLLAGDINKVYTTQKPDDEGAANVVDNSEDISVVTYPTNNWRFLVDVLDRIMFYVFLIVFFILLIARVL